jgi:glycosyltransferase involved in cell wall biosynthesis
MNKKKCIFLVSSLDAGGAETYLLRFLAFAGNHIEAIVITKSGRKGALLHEYQKYCSKILTVNSGYLSFGSWLKIYKIFKKEKASTICDFTGNFAGIPLTIANILGVENRIAFYRRSSNAFKENYFNLLYNSGMNFLVYRNATQILANSIAGLNFFYRPNQHDQRMSVIRNGIDLQNFLPSSTKQQLRKRFGIRQDTFVIGHTGRLNVAKNHPTLLAIGAEIKKAGYDFQLVFCGKDTEKLLVNLPDPLTKSDVISLGYQSNIPDVLATFDFYIFPSITEGMPNALMEAMVFGLPFLASNIEPIAEIVPQSHQSQLIPPNDVDGFVLELKKILQEKVDLKSMSCQTFAQKEFNSDKQMSAFLKRI